MMVTALAELPPKLRGNPAVEEIVGALTTVRAKNRELRETARSAVSPMRAFATSQGGAALNGAVRAFVGEKYATTATWAAIAALFGIGLYTERPDFIHAANGALAPFTANQTYALLTRARESVTAPIPPE